jgi:hypothetical protein
VTSRLMRRLTKGRRSPETFMAQGEAPRFVNPAIYFEYFFRRCCSPSLAVVNPEACSEGWPRANLGRGNPWEAARSLVPRDFAVTGMKQLTVEWLLWRSRLSWKNHFKWDQ